MGMLISPPALGYTVALSLFEDRCGRIMNRPFLPSASDEEELSRYYLEQKTNVFCHTNNQLVSAVVGAFTRFHLKFPEANSRSPTY